MPIHLWAIHVGLELAENDHDFEPFNMAIGRKLRGCDLVKTKVADAMASTQIRERVPAL